MQNETAFKEFLAENYKENELLARMFITKNGPVNTYCFSASDLAEKDLTGKNCYMTLNTLQFKNRKIRRNQEHVSRLKFCYADLDTYNLQPEVENPTSGYYERLNEGILLELEKEHFGRTIPVPSYVISSGRGMYLLWRVDEHINALPRWKKVQRYLYDILRDFGADSCVTTDYARVFRAIGSENPKSGNRVKIIRNYGRKYTLYRIMEEFMPSAKCVQAPISISSKKSRYFCFEKEQKLYMDRMHDLKSLLTRYRDRDDAYRENILFLYRYYYLCLYKDKEKALKATMKLNASLVHPLPEDEVRNATSSAEKYFDKGCSFGITNEKLIEFLNIRAHEMAAMQSFPTEEKKKEKKRKQNRHTYLVRLERSGKDTKKQAIIERRKKIFELIQKGKKQAEICKILGISKSTYCADKKVIETVRNAIGKVRNTYTAISQENISDFSAALQRVSMQEAEVQNLDTGPPEAQQQIEGRKSIMKSG